jgi:hypothetical protein
VSGIRVTATSPFISANALFCGEVLDVLQLYVKGEFLDLAYLDRYIWAVDVAVGGHY